MSNLAQCLIRTPSRDLRQIAGRLFPGDLASWGRASNITSFLAEKLLDEEFLAGFLDRLSERQRRVITLLVWTAGREGLSGARMEGLLASTGDDAPKETVLSLAARGIVFASPYQWGGYCLPEDLAAKIRAVLVRRALPRAVPSGEVASANVFSGHFYEDCLTFMAYLHKNEVALTQKNAIPKRTLAKIFNIMQFKEATADIPADFFYTIRFSLLLGYCINFVKAVYFHERMAKVMTDPVVRWFKEKPSDMVVKAAPQVWDFLCRACPNPVTGALIELLRRMKEDQWYAYAEVAGAAQRLIDPYTCQAPEPGYYLDIMLDTGLLAEGRSHDGERLVRFGFWSPGKHVSVFPSLPGEEDGFWVQPNFEILAPPRLAPALRWQLEMVATPVKMDHACIYALTKEAALGFFDRGGDIGQMVGFLEKYSKSPLPQNVLFTIREWGASYGRVSFLDVFLLRCDDAKLADEIEHHPKLRPYVRRRFDQNHLVVSRDQYEPLLAALQKQGYLPRKGIFRPSN